MSKKRFKLVGLLLGSFDPPHIGHIDAALQAINLVDEVWFVPAWQNPCQDKTVYLGPCQKIHWTDSAQPVKKNP